MLGSHSYFGITKYTTTTRCMVILKTVQKLKNSLKAFVRLTVYWMLKPTPGQHVQALLGTS